MTLRAAILASLVASVAWNASASDFCQRLGELTVEARSDFADRPIKGTFEPDLPGKPECSLILQLGGAKAMNCQWSFPFRAPEAGRTFKATVEATQTCEGSKVTLHQDQQVNHPDTYDLRKFVLNGVGIDVSLKDKGALQKSLVFLRIGRPAL